MLAMILCNIFGGAAAVMFLLLLLVVAAGYTVLPPTIEDRFRATLILSIGKILRITPFKVTEVLGYGTFFDNIIVSQRISDIVLDKRPKSASIGTLKVNWEEMAGQRVLIYRPNDVTDGEILPCMIYIHGGGWSQDNPVSHDHFTYKLAMLTRKVSICNHYRRAPQHPFPAPLDDCLGVIRHILRHGKDLGIDVSRVGIVGDSAGGNIATAAALQLCGEKSSGLPALKYLLLFQPIVQAMTFRLPSHLEIGRSNPILTPNILAGLWALYMGLDRKRVNEYAAIIESNRHVPPKLLKQFSDRLDTRDLPEKFRKPRPELVRDGKGAKAKAKVDKCTSSYEAELQREIKYKLTDPRLCPLMAPDLSGLPPTMVVVSEFDIIRDEGLLFAHRLRESGVRTQVNIGKGFHGDFFCSFFPEWTGLNSKTGEKAIESVRLFMEQEQ